MVRVTKDRDVDEINQGSTLGHLRLRHVETNEMVLIPTPSSDPNDPLNWSKGFRVYIAVLVCLAMFFCNFLAAGPTVAIVEVTEDYFGPPGPAFAGNISKVAYFFTTTALLQGLGNLIWMPLLLKYGERPVYIISFTCYTACAGSRRVPWPLTIADIFFLHERGTFMAMYTASLSSGVSGGIILAGLITIHQSWRYIYYIATALIGALTLLVVFTMPESSFNRGPTDVPTNRENVSALYTTEAPVMHSIHDVKEHTHIEAGHMSHTPTVDENLSVEPHHYPKETYLQGLRIFHGKFTNESLFRMAARPVALLILPPILWATLVMSVTIGFLVAISSNFASAFATVYGFQPYQSGLCFIAGMVGNLIAIFFGGVVSDQIADFFTRRNGGIREPEMRLPAVTIGLVAAPLGLLLYGVGINNSLPWIVPTLGLGFLSFAVSQATNVSLVYIINSYRPIAGETIVTQLAFKSCFGFLLSFYTNPWVDEDGYSHAFGAMAGISSAVLAMWVLFYIWGQSIRRATLKWRVMSFVGWNVDREVGE